MRNKQILSNNQTILFDSCDLLELSDIRNDVLLLEKRIHNPESYVVITGETSSGKSTLLNGLIGKALLPVSSTPTQADVVEILCNPGSKEEVYFGVDLTGELEVLSSSEFRKHNLAKEKRFSRLLLTVPEYRQPLPGLRIFDTPGFGSIHSEHDEILRDFIPQSDCVIHVVSYRAGIRETDAEFIRFLREIKDPSLGMFLVINNAPRGEDFDKRVVDKIVKQFGVLYYEAPKFFVVESEYLNDSQTDEEMLPAATALWTELANWLNRSERMSMVDRGLLMLQLDLLRSVLDPVLNKLFSTMEKKEIEEIGCNTLRSKDEIIFLINRRFDELINFSLNQIEQIAPDIVEKINSEIDSRSSWTGKDDTIAFVNAHLLEHYTKVETAPIFEDIKSSLSALDKEIDELLNTVIKKHMESVGKVNLKYRDLALGMVENRIQGALLNSANSLFSKFGGRGGVKAGIPNLAKSGLKKVGDLFGITFKRETHNSLARTIAKFGLNSTRALTAAIAVVAEGITYIIDAQTWRYFLKRKVEKTIPVWRKQLGEAIKSDLDDLRHRNIDSISKIFDSFAPSVEPKSMEIEPAVLHSLRKQLDEAIEDTTTIINEV